MPTSGRGEKDTTADKAQTSPESRDSSSHQMEPDEGTISSSEDEEGDMDSAGEIDVGGCRENVGDSGHVGSSRHTSNTGHNAHWTMPPANAYIPKLDGV